MPNAPEFEPGQGDYTIAAWIRVPADGSYSKLLENTNSQCNHWIQITSPDYTDEIWFASKAGSTVATQTSFMLTRDNTWHAIVGVRKNQHTLQLYVDGLLVSEDTRTDLNDIQTYSSNLILSGWSDQCGTAHAFKGDVDELRIYNRALTLEEILAFSDISNW